MSLRRTGSDLDIADSIQATSTTQQTQQQQHAILVTYGTTANPTGPTLDQSTGSFQSAEVTLVGRPGLS